MAAPKKKPTVVIDPGRELVACLDGPMSNQWFYLDEWQQRRESSRRYSPDTPAGCALGYVPVRGTKVPHPTVEGVEANALAYRPDVAIAAMTRKSA